MHKKNQQSFEDRLQFRSVVYEEKFPGSDFNETAEFNELKKSYQRQRIMIYSEGLVFISLLAFGLYRVRNSFYKELALANQQRNFLLSITHELKSPLASIKLTLQTIFSRDLSKEQTLKLVNNSMFDVDRLEGLVDNILFAARIENDNYGFSTEAINLSQLIKDLAEKFSIGQVKVESQTEPDIWWRGDRTGISSVLVNLIENGIKYSPGQADIALQLKRKGEYLLIDVKDRGIGVPDGEKLKIFEKFYRIGNEDTRSTKGTGLGLYIVKRVIELHDGKIEVSDNHPHGTCFTITLPSNINAYELDEELRA